MKKDEIYEMAKKAGLYTKTTVIQSAIPLNQMLTVFANLVAQEVRDRIMFGSRDDWVLAEREACAKLCETLWNTKDNGMATEEEAYGEKCAAAIRARGEA